MFCNIVIFVLAMDVCLRYLQLLKLGNVIVNRSSMIEFYDIIKITNERRLYKIRSPVTTTKRCNC